MYIDADEEFDRKTLFVLNKIQRELRKLDNESSLIQYHLFDYPINREPFIPKPLEERNILNILKSRNIIKEALDEITFESGADSRGQSLSAGLIFSFKVNLDQFNTLYKEFKDKIAAYNTNSEGKLTIVEEDGVLNLIYFSKKGSKHEAKLKVNSNEGRIIKYFIKNMGISIEPKLLENVIKDPRRNAEYADISTRVRYALDAIKDKLKIEKLDELFITSGGYGLKKIPVEIQ